MDLNYYTWVNATCPHTACPETCRHWDLRYRHLRPYTDHIQSNLNILSIDMLDRPIGILR